MTTTTAQQCPHCGTRLATDAPAGLCPRCLLVGALRGTAHPGGDGDPAAPPHAQATLAEEPASPAAVAAERFSAPFRFGDYELTERIASGGMGVVYKARESSINRTVALKMILSGRLATQTEVQRFYAEAEAAANLDHPHIVPIYEVGEYEGRHYFTMKYIDGGNLDSRIEEFRRDPRATATLIATCARAVHYGHRRGVLHRDLKPGNLLLDAAGNPYVGDFGVAKRVDAAINQTHTGTIVGTPAYMAPEQAAGRTKEVTTAADVYSLGAILYEVLTGHPPFRADSLDELLRQVREDPPPRPRAVKPAIDPDLETICLKCLEKDRHQRYDSAEALAEELERYVAGEAIVARPIGRPARFWRWCLRHPAYAGLGATLVVSVVFMMAAALFVARGHRQARVNDVLETNAYAAQWVAGTVLLQLKDFCGAVERTADADEARLRDLIATGDRAAAQRYLQEQFEQFNDPARGPARAASRERAFDSVFIVKADGLALGRWPAPDDPEDYFRTRFAHRDYFQGARRHARAGRRSAYVSHAFRSHADALHKIAIARPVLAADGRTFLGALVATTATDPTFGPLNLQGGNRSAVLTARLEDPADAPSADPQHIVLLHPGLTHGEYVPVAHDKLRQFDAGDGGEQLELNAGVAPVHAADYQDPVALADSPVGPKRDSAAGRWLAGFAQVGKTHLVVIVQTRLEDATALDRLLVRRMTLWADLALISGALLLALILWTAARRARQMRAGGGA